MAVSIDWATKIITVPQADLTFIGGSIYELDTDWFRLQLKDLEDSEAGIVFPVTHNHNTQVSLGGIQYSRIIEIINGYTITFEDGSYVVNLVGSNNNILDVTNLNSVQIRSNNSAGLINITELQQDIFGGAVTVDTINGTSGILYPQGTPLAPVNNIPDAMSIATQRGFDTLKIIGNITLDSGDNVQNMTLVGQNATRTTMTINAGAETLDCEILDAKVTGNLDGGSILKRCVIESLNYINGFVIECAINPGIISLGGTSTAFFLDCWSGVPGTGTPEIDMNGSGSEDTPLAIRNYSGGIKLVQKTGAGSASIDLNSGQVIIDSSCNNGTVVVRGDGKVIDENGSYLGSGTINTNLVLLNETTYSKSDDLLTLTDWIALK